MKVPPSTIILLFLMNIALFKWENPQKQISSWFLHNNVSSEEKRDNNICFDGCIKREIDKDKSGKEGPLRCFGNKPIVKTVFYIVINWLDPSFNCYFNLIFSYIFYYWTPKETRDREY